MNTRHFLLLFLFGLILLACALPPPGHLQINGSGHILPGPAPIAPLIERIVGPKNRDIDGPADIWAFFSRHVRPEIVYGPLVAVSAG